MLALDIKLALFVAILTLLLVGIGAVWLDRRFRRWPDVGVLGPALERAPVGLLILNHDRSYRYANPMARRLLSLGPSRGRLPDADWLDALLGDRATVRETEGARSRARMIRLAAGMAPEGDLDEQAGRLIRWWITLVDDGDLVLLEDVTAQHCAENAARTLTNDLAHELRTPLATILTHLEVLSLTDISREIGQQSLGLLKEEGRRMSRLIHQMLELGRLETTVELARRPIDLAALAEETVSQVGPQAKDRGIAIALEVDAPLPLVMGNVDRLRQVFLNLLDNAVKYSRHGDRVSVTLRHVDGGLECSIRDTGPGIPRQYLPHLTRRFTRAAPVDVAGSGLGLTLVEAILRRHESRLEITSETEGMETGTTVRFHLPSIGGVIAPPSEGAS